MPLVIGTDTYIDVEEANDYLSTYGQPGQQVDESGLVKATLALDRLYGQRFIGRPAVAGQPLCFPRLGSEDIPLQVQHATVELAAYMQGPGDPYSQPDALITKVTKKLDGVGEKTLEYASPYGLTPLHKIDVILAPLLRSQSSTGIAYLDVVRG